MANVSEWIPVLLSVLTAVAAFLSYATMTRPKGVERRSTGIESSIVADHPITSSRQSEGVYERQFRLFQEYHDNGLEQAKYSFWFSLIFASLGFVVILIPIFSSTNNAEDNQTIISLASGAVIEAVSALFFVQSNRARQLMIEFFDRLRADRKLDEALGLARSVPDETLRSRIFVLLSLEFVQAKPAESLLAQLLLQHPELAEQTLRLDGEGAASESTLTPRSAPPV